MCFVRQYAWRGAPCRRNSRAALANLEEHKAKWLGKHSVVAAAVATTISFAIAFHDHVLSAIKQMLK
jgi:hypothetical protein